MNQQTQVTHYDAEMQPAQDSSQFAVVPHGAAPVRLQTGNAMLSPKSLDEALKVADYLANSSIVPKDFQGKPGNILVAIQWGTELGLAPLQAMQSIAVINGRPSLWGDTVLGLCRASGALEYMNEELDEESMTATCTVKRKGDPSEVVSTFSMADADKAGLSRKDGPWKTYPKRMLQMRARGFALRDTFPDVLRGLYVAEEAQDMPVMRDVTPAGDAPSKPKPKSKSAATKSKLTGGDEPEEKVTLETVLAEVQACETQEELTAAGARCGKLTGNDKNKAREAYSQRLAYLKDKAAQHPTQEELDRAEAEARAAADAAAAEGGAPDGDEDGQGA
ncbi:hypothetical protein BMI86_10140 [Thioclava sp. DLFJ5-1]|uniref:recombinase RecT n=1 Tax=Thioclava sp. DLFJ5-1 TaxID=1915314 RepID=UPI0009C5B728|nr:recombinase RecT [Thioclava sp. DLFJ5-1]OOY20857.1 hypothetical protein BMI86_10140 [Thioclava sp. DLFJ5-1]